MREERAPGDVASPADSLLRTHDARGEQSAPAVLSLIALGGEGIDAVIAAAHAQSLTEWELLVVDEGPQPRARQEDATDGRVRWIRRPEGVIASDALNDAAAAATGEFLGFVEQGFGPELFGALLTQARASGADLVVSGEHEVARTSLTIALEPGVVRRRGRQGLVIRRSSWSTLGLAFVRSPQFADLLPISTAFAALSFDVAPIPNGDAVAVSPTAAELAELPTILDYLEQETAAAGVIESHSDRSDVAAYYREILDGPLWGLLVALAADHEPDFERVRSPLLELVSRAPQRARAGLDPRKRLAYHFALRQMPGAVALTTTDPDDPRFAHRLAEVAQGPALSSAITLERELHVVIKQFLATTDVGTLIDDPYELGDAEVMRAYATARTMDLIGRGVFDPDFERALLENHRHPALIRGWAIRPSVPSGPPSLKRRATAAFSTFRERGFRAGLGEARRASRHLSVTAGARSLRRRLGG